jgi:hypothetical protein
VGQPVPDNDILAQTRDFLRQRQQAYQAAFGGPIGQLVLADLARFCRATETTFDANERAHALKEGRREVWLRIQEHLQLSDDDLWNLKKG